MFIQETAEYEGLDEDARFGNGTYLMERVFPELQEAARSQFLYYVAAVLLSLLPFPPFYWLFGAEVLEIPTFQKKKKGSSHRAALCFGSSLTISGNSRVHSCFLALILR